MSAIDLIKRHFIIYWLKDWIAISAEPATDKPRAWKITDSSVSSLKAVKKYRNLKFVYYSVGHFVKLMRRVSMYNNADSTLESGI